MCCLSSDLSTAFRGIVSGIRKQSEIYNIVLKYKKRALFCFVLKSQCMQSLFNLLRANPFTDDLSTKPIIVLIRDGPHAAKAWAGF